MGFNSGFRGLSVCRNFSRLELYITESYRISTNKIHISQINVLILKYFDFFCSLLHVSSPRVHLQEDVCMYRYGIVCFMRISITTLVGKGVWCGILRHRPHSSTKTLLYLLDCLY